MSTTENTIDITKMSAEEIEKYLAKKKQDETKALEKERKEYEKNRDETVSKLITNAKEFFKMLSDFKQEVHTEMGTHAEKLANYGKLRGNSKGGFSITNSDDTMRITRRRDTEPVWDERSAKAVELIKDFLSDIIKKRDVKLYVILIGFLEKNEKGDLEFNKVMDLYKHEHEFDDPRWKEGLRLIKESFSNHLKGFGYEFKIKNTSGKWESLSLNFSSL